jgi:hypothetical protein
MNAPHAVTAYFTDPSTTIAGNINFKSGSVGGRDWSISLTNNGPGIVLGAVPTSLTLVQVAGTPCTPVTANGLYTQPQTIAVNQTAYFDWYINFTGCSASSRFTATIAFSANNGTLTGSFVRTNQFE